jgi:hypothetical protein
MPKTPTPEYKIRPVSRFVVTEYVDTGSTGSSRVVGEFDSRAQATAVVQAFTGRKDVANAWNVLPEHDVPAMLRNIAEDAAQWTKRGVVVLIQNDGAVIAYGLGAKVGDVNEILDAGRGALQELYP